MTTYVSQCEFSNSKDYFTSLYDFLYIRTQYQTSPFFFFFEINNQSVAFGEISVDEKDQQRKHIKSMYDLHSINMTNSHHHHVLHFREYSPTLETMTD